MPDIDHEPPPNECFHETTYSKPLALPRATFDALMVVQWCQDCLAFRVSATDDEFHTDEWVGGF